MDAVKPKTDKYSTGGRSAYWDNIKGILILLVVLAHFLYQFRRLPAVNTVVTAIYTFHMPAFVFASGYFGKSERSRSFEGLIRLVFLFFVFNSVMGFIYGLDPILEPKYSYWYLLALIVWRLTAHRIAQFREILAALGAVAVFAGFYGGINNTLSVARIIAFYPYYMAGYLLSEEKSRALTETKTSARLGKGAVFAAAVAVLICVSMKFYGFTENDLLMYPYDRNVGAFGRVTLFAVGFTVIYALRCLVPDKRIPLLSMLGRNSLWIFLFHRPITLEAEPLLSTLPVPALIAASVALTAVTCTVLGCEPFCAVMNRFAAGGAALFGPGSRKSRAKTAAGACAGLTALMFVALIVIDAYSAFLTPPDEDDPRPAETADVIFNTISSEEQRAFDGAFRLTFAGDLILLEDQVKRAYDEETGVYDFAEMFEYAKPHISSADYAIGVFEGPMAGAEAGYTSGNFDDGKELYLNFPDEFAAEVRRTGFDLVTTANNHVLDKGEEGAARTLDVLDELGLDHTGSYRSAEEKEISRVKLVEADGIRFAVLSYTYGSNYYDTEVLVDGGASYVTSVISGTEGKLFERLKKEVERDFERARALSPDLIVVLPHIGTQFLNSPDSEQEAWFGVFKELGADIILGDHPHAVQPALLEEYGGRTVFTAYCPGNFANIYRKNGGDASALIDVYIDRETKTVIGGGIVPLYTQSRMDGNFRALPTYAIENDPSLRAQLSTDDYELAKAAHAVVTSATLGVKSDITGATESYLFNERGFLRQKTTGAELTEEMKAGALWQALSRAGSVCFLGDSVTEGTKNGGCPWYEPIEEHLADKEIYNFSKGGCTISYLADNIGNIPAAELYVIAVGTNDVRYRDETVCAMTAEEFARRADGLGTALSEKSPGAEIVFIAPWYSTDGDKLSPLPFDDKTALNSEYSAALETLCAERGFGFINANGVIAEKLGRSPDRTYLLDHIHPNASRGVRMYSEAVLSAKE